MAPDSKPSGSHTNMRGENQEKNKKEVAGFYQYSKLISAKLDIPQI